MSPPLQPQPLAYSTSLALMARSRLSRRREGTSRPLASPSQVCLVPGVVSPQPGPAPLHWPQLLSPPRAALAGLTPGHTCSAFRSPPSYHGPFPGLPLPPGGSSDPPSTHQPEPSFYEATPMTPVFSFQTSGRYSARFTLSFRPLPVPHQWDDVPLASFIHSPALRPRGCVFCFHADGSAFLHWFGSQRSIPWNIISPFSAQILLILNPLKWCLPPKCSLYRCQISLPFHFVSPDS